MTVGDRVTTKHGPGRITDIHTDQNWTYRRPNPVAYVIVRVDGEPYGRILLPHQVQPIQEEQLTMNETTETTTTEPEPAEPTPTDPEPEPDDEEAELTPWP